MGNRDGITEQGVPLLVDSEAAGIMQGALDRMKLGPGKPGPGDEWKIPSGPSDEMVTEEDRTVEPANSSRVSLLRRLTRKR